MENMDYPSLPLLPDQNWSGVVDPDIALFMGKIEQTVYKQMTYVKLWLFDSNTGNHLTVAKKSSSTFKNVIYKMCSQIIYVYIYIYINRVWL